MNSKLGSKLSPKFGTRYNGNKEDEEVESFFKSEPRSRKSRGSELAHLTQTWNMEPRKS